MKSYESLSLIIIDKLKELVDGNDATIFVDVYDGGGVDRTGFPYAELTDAGGDGEILDTSRNDRSWIFEVKLVHEQGNKTIPVTRAIMRDAVDRVVAMFDEDPQLRDESGQQQCMHVKVVPLVYDYTIQDQPYVFARFEIICRDVVNNY